MNDQFQENGPSFNPPKPDDDFFGDQGDSTAKEEERKQRELEAIRRPHFTAGVRQGVSDAHEENIQGGFDEGFIQGAKAVAEPGYLYGAASTVLGFYSRFGCYARSESRVQKLYDTEVPTLDLRALQASVLKLRADIRQMPVDGVVEVQHGHDALSNVSFVEVPSDVKQASNDTQSAETNS